MIKIKILRGLLLALVWGPMSLNAAVVFEQFDDFTQSPSVGWSSNSTYVISNQNILGQFGNQTVSLNLSLAAHHRVTLAFDFWTINTWDGNGVLYPGSGIGAGLGADRFTAEVVGGPIIVDSSFSNHRYQNYPDPINGGSYAPFTGAAEVIGVAHEAMVRWHFEETFSHHGDLTINFTGSNLQNLSDESWGIDNVHVVAESVPEPTSIILISLGLFGVLGYRQKQL